MEILGRAVSEKFDNVFKAATDTAATQRKSISFKHTREHPNQILHSIRGIRATVPEHPNLLGIYLNETLSEQEYELVAVHELCHEIARSEGFGYCYGIRGVPERQLDLWENIAICIGDCFTHLTVNRLMERYGYNTRGFDNCILDEITDKINQRKKCGTAALAHHAILHISNVYHDKYSLSVLNLRELENLLDNWDQRILEFSSRAQLAIPNVDLFPVTGCFNATIALRNAVGTELGFDLSTRMHFQNPQTSHYE